MSEIEKILGRKITNVEFLAIVGYSIKKQIKWAKRTAKEDLTKSQEKI